MQIITRTGIGEKIKRNSFPIEIGGKSPAQLEAELTRNGIIVGSYAQDMLRSLAFSTLEQPTEIRAARLSLRDLGLDRKPTLGQIFKQAEPLGLDRLPAEAGPHRRLQDSKQRLGDFYFIAMDPIVERSVRKDVFLLESYENGVWLRSDCAEPYIFWHPDSEFVFGLRK